MFVPKCTSLGVLICVLVGLYCLQDCPKRVAMGHDDRPQWWHNICLNSHKCLERVAKNQDVFLSHRMSSSQRR